MSLDPPLVDTAALEAFVELIGRQEWASRLRDVQKLVAPGKRAGRALLQYHAIELTLDRLRRPSNRERLPAECRLASLAADAASLAETLTPRGRVRLRTLLRIALERDGTLVPAFHLLRTAALQRARGFEVLFSGLESDAPFDLLLARGGTEAEVACDIISADVGRDLHRGAWFHLADRIDPDLQTWLSAHPGRYILKMTLPQGLKGSLHQQPAEGDALSLLHGRIRDMLKERRRADRDEAVVLRLDPLLLAAAQADELGLISKLRREFGPEAHLSVTAAGQAVFVMAARSGRENAVASAVRRRLADIAPIRLSGARPGILALFVEDTDRTEWRGLRETLELEGEARQFLTGAAARAVVAVTCASRLELFGLPPPDGIADGELRFRNPAHPAAKIPALAPAVLSSV